MDMHYEEIIDSDWVSDTLFLAHQPIYAGNIRLWNDWEGGVTPNNMPTHHTFIYECISNRKYVAV